MSLHPKQDIPIYNRRISGIPTYPDATAVSPAAAVASSSPLLSAVPLDETAVMLAAPVASLKPGAAQLKAGAAQFKPAPPLVNEVQPATQLTMFVPEPTTGRNRVRRTVGDTIAMQQRHEDIALENLNAGIVSSNSARDIVENHHTLTSSHNVDAVALIAKQESEELTPAELSAGVRMLLKERPSVTAALGALSLANSNLTLAQVSLTESNLTQKGLMKLKMTETTETLRAIKGVVFPHHEILSGPPQLLLTDGSQVGYPHFSGHPESYHHTLSGHPESYHPSNPSHRGHSGSYAGPPSYFAGHYTGPPAGPPAGPPGRGGRGSGRRHGGGSQ